MKRKSSTLLLLFLYKIIYEFIYAFVSSNVFSYYGLTWVPNIEKCIFSYFIFLFLVLLPQRKESVTKYLLDIYLVFTITPMLSLYWQSNRSTTYIIMCFLTYLIMYLGCNFINVKNTSKIIVGDLFKHINISTVLIALTVAFIALFTLQYGIADTTAANLENVYVVRKEREFRGIWGYLINWMPYSIIPCIMCIGLYKKSVLQTAVAVIFQLYLFLFTGSKTTLFSIGLILFSYYLVLKRKDFIKWWVIAVSGLNMLTTLFWLRTDNLLPFAIFPIRLLTIPASISNNHYDFFSNNPKLLFAENFIGRIFGIESPYNTFSTYLVSKGAGNANTGLFGDAYDNGGFLVMLLYAIIFIIIFKYIDGIYDQYRNDKNALPVFVGILTYSMIYLNDGSLTALLITGGLFINIFVLMHFEKWNKWDREWKILQ